MNKILKVTLIVFGVIVVGIVILVFTFIQSMKPDQEKEEQVKIQAEEYLENQFSEHFEVYDTLYDNMGNFGFEYAAMARDKERNTQFFVYYDDVTNQMVDTYIAEKWEDDLESEISPFIRENFGKKTNFFVYFDDELGNELGIYWTDPRSYKEFNVSPRFELQSPETGVTKTNDSLMSLYLS